MNSNEQQQPKLTDEEVWLRAYCASISNDNIYDWSDNADFTLREFKERFRQNERT